MVGGQDSVSLADRLVDRGCLTIEQKTGLKSLVADELKNHGGDAEATLAATVDGRFLDAIRDVGATVGDDMAHLAETLAPVANYEVRRFAEIRRRLKVPIGIRGLISTRRGAWDRSGSPATARLGRQIALKELRPEQTDNSIVCSRFLYEAKITAQLEHPGIVPVYELGGGPVPFYTMRFVKGRTLSEATRAYHKERVAGTADSLGLVKLLERVSGSLPCRCVCPFAGSHSPRSERAERDPGRLWRGHRARLGHRQTDRPGQRTVSPAPSGSVGTHLRSQPPATYSNASRGRMARPTRMKPCQRGPMTRTRRARLPRLDSGAGPEGTIARPASGNSWIHGSRAGRWTA